MNKQQYSKKNTKKSAATTSQHIPVTRNKSVDTAMQRRLREVLLITATAIGLFLLLALVTYHYTDRSWSNTGNGVIHNAAGRVGAEIASGLLSLFGYPGYIFPCLFVLLFWSIYREGWKADDGKHLFRIVLLIIGLVIVLLSACGLSNIWLTATSHFLPMSAGGILGAVVSKALVQTFNPAGGSLLLVALLLAGITLLSGLSWVAVSEKLVALSSQMLTSGFRSMRDKAVDYKTQKERRQELNRRYQEASLTTKSVPEKFMAAATQELPTLKKAFTVQPQNKSVNEKTMPNGMATGVFASAMAIDNKRGASAKVKSDGFLPSLSLLDTPPVTQKSNISEEKLAEMSASLEQHLAHFGVEAQVVGVATGPVVMRFELNLAPGMKVSKVSNLDKDLARSMATASVRVVEIIPGKPYIGIEIPNQNRELVCLKELLVSEQYQKSQSPLTLVLGKDIAGKPVISDLQKMPHLLVAGTTGSGKSVSLNAMILSMLFKSTPEKLRFIMIDPKMLELSIYKDIPHLLAPVVTDMDQANNALRWCIGEMERRYRLMSKLGARNLESLNLKIKAAIDKGESIKDPLFIPSGEAGEEAPVLDQVLPYIVILIDELADMMMVVGKKVEQLIARIAQKARAAGMHMILATQRPSVDVITGLIKANIPARMAFSVSSRVDSRTILDQQGAHQLLGYGDMLALMPGESLPQRRHGSYVSDQELHQVTDALRASGEPQYISVIVDELDDLVEIAGIDPVSRDDNAENDPLYDQAVAIVCETRRASISLVQRRLKIGYNRAANLLEAMETARLVSTMSSSGVREVLIPEGGN